MEFNSSFPMLLNLDPGHLKRIRAEARFDLCCLSSGPFTQLNNLNEIAIGIVKDSRRWSTLV
jgi:hypothetical protein